jgi:RNA polymerase sigma-70 factor (ECF subfamily)
MDSALSTFEPHRPRLLRIAYRMLGSAADAEDVVQDAYLRWHEKADRDAVLSHEAFLISATTRLAIDRLRRLRTEREAYYGSWLPEPIGASAGLGDELSYAALVLLERLSPDERAAFLLREVFDLDYELVASTLDKTEPACRKLVQRARERLAERNDDVALSPPDRAAQRALLTQLVAATRAESATELERLLSESVRMTSDGGGKVFAARYPLAGARRVAQTLWRIAHKGEHALCEVEGEPAVLFFQNGALTSAMFAQLRDGKVDQLFALLNPDKLARLSFKEP